MNQIIKLVEKLSPENQKEVINFIEFLLEKQKKKEKNFQILQVL